jgi:hypothetical protein
MDCCWPSGASSHFNVDVFVFATSSVSFVRLRLPMICLANESEIGWQVQTRVGLITARDSTTIPEVVTVLQ